MSIQPSLLNTPTVRSREVYFLDDEEHGIFAIRGVGRPNPIGISVVRLVRVEKNVLHIQDLDIVDGTPLLDIKPYVPEFDVTEVTKIGWLERKVHRLRTLKDDGRFMKYSDGESEG